MQPKRISLWLVWGWFLASCLDSLSPTSEVYRADPISSSVLISLAITAAVTAAQVGLSYYQARKQKVPNVDRGKVDDIRASVPGYGEVIPKGWGIFRIAPIWIWESPAVDHPVTTPGHSGGKSPKPPTATTVDHVYLKSIAGVFHDGPLYGKNPVRRIWFDNDLVASFLLEDLAATKSEAELGVLSGGATVSTQAECSGAKKVTGIGSGGKCTVSVNTTADDFELAVHYTSVSDLTYKVYVDGVLLGDLVCPSSGGATIVAIATYADPIPLTAGDHLIRFENAGAACPDLDCIELAIARNIDEIDVRPFTSVIDPNKLPPSNLDHGWAYNDFLPDPVFDAGGGGGIGGGGGRMSQFNLGKYGQPSIRIYNGSMTQLADPAIVAQEGVERTSAYRGWGYLVIEGLQLQGGRVPNVTLEVDQGVHSLPVIVKDIYAEVGITNSQLHVTALNGLQLGDTDIDPGTYATASWQNKTNTTSVGGAISKTSGADSTYNAGASHNGTLASATNGAIRFTASQGACSVGFSTNASPTNTSHILFGLQLHHADASSENRLTLQAVTNGANGTSDIGVWAPGDVFQIEIRNGKFRAYQNGIELGGFSAPVASFPLYPAFVAYSSGAGVSACSVSLAGAIGEAPSSNAGGLLLSSRRSAADLLSDIQTRFQFDMVEVDGVVKAILRSTATSDITIPYTDMRAVIANPGQLPELPAFDCQINDIDPMLLPARVDVNYLDPGMDYHNNVQTEMCIAEQTRYDNQSVSLSIIDSADNMYRLAVTLMHKAEMEGRTFSFQTSWKYMHVHPGSVATLTLQNATHTVRITQAKYSLPAGVIEFSGVRQAASLYSPTGSGSISDGYEAPIAAHAANTKGVIIDGPLLRPEDAGDGTQPVIYIAGCGRGSGAWPGYFLNVEFPRGSGNYQLVTSGSQASQIGETEGALATVADPSVWDRTNSLVINFFTPTVLESVTEEELLQNAELNLLAIVKPSTGEVEYIQFKTATAGVPVAPYLARYTVDTFLRGRVGTDGNVGIHGFSPTEIDGCKFWFKADSLSLNDGDPVGTWSDSSGNANDATQGTAANKPTKQTVSGDPVVRFDGSNDFMSFTEVTTLRTVFAVIKHATGNQDNAAILGHATSFNFHGGTTTLLNSTVNSIVSSIYQDGTSTSPATATKPTAFQIVTLITSASAAAQYIANDRNLAARYWNGDYKEIVAFDSVLSEGNRRLVEAYLADKYGITIPFTASIGDDVVLIDSTIRPRRMELSDIGM